MKNYLPSFFLFILALVFSTQVQSQSNTWQFTGGPYYGAATSMVCNASGHVFAGTTTGIFRSTDDGDTWTWVTQSMGGIGVSALMVKSDGIIFAGLSNGSILYSTTNGSSWNVASDGLPGMSITDLKQRGTDSILACTLGGGIYYSVNNGTTWSPLNQGLANLQVQSLAFRTDGKILAGTKNGLWYSSDNGSHWDTLPGSSAGDVRKIVIDQSDNIYAINYPSFSGVDSSRLLMPIVFKSTNNGSTWSNLSIDSIYIPALYGTDRFGRPILIYPESWKILKRFNFPTFIAIDQNGNLYANSYYSPSNGYGSMTALRHSTNSGSTWDTVLYCSGGGFGGDGGIRYYAPNLDSVVLGSITSICFSPNNYIFIGSTLGGIIRIPSSVMSSWKKVNRTLVSRPVYSQVKKLNGKMFVMTEWGLFRSSSAVNAWELINQNCININPTALAFNTAEDLFVACGYIYRSSDEGNAWNIDTCGMFVGPLTIQGMAAAHNGTLYAGSYQFYYFYRSTDNGLSWQKSDPSVACTTLVAGNSGNMYGLCGPYVFISTDDGTTWTTRPYRNDGNAPTGNPEFNTIHEINSYTYIVGTKNGIYKSVDTAKTWQSANMGLPFICKALYWDNTKPSWIDTVFGFPDVPAIAGNALGRIFIGCNDGIYSSMDTGKTWQLYGQGIPPGVSVNSLLLDENGYLYAGTSSGVVYKSALSTVGVAKVPTSIPYTWMLEQNYPNPFNPSTLINYQISTLSKVSLKVYDLLGREIVTLINEEQSAGPHMVKWDASHVATGVYFYMLAAGGFVQTKKMLLMK